MYDHGVKIGNTTYLLTNPEWAEFVDLMAQCEERLLSPPTNETECQLSHWEVQQDLEKYKRIAISELIDKAGKTDSQEETEEWTLVNDLINEVGCMGLHPYQVHFPDEAYFTIAEAAKENNEIVADTKRLIADVLADHGIDPE